MNRSAVRTSVGIVLCGLLAGCMPKMTVEDMKKMRQQKPAELEKLNRLVGTWEAGSEAKFAGLDEPMKSTGTSKFEWVLDGWYLMETADAQMGDVGKMSARSLWTWDVKAKKFRIWWFDDWGTTGRGTVTYNEKCDCFCINASGSAPWGTSRGKGCMKFTDDKTMDWCWREWPGWDALGLFKVADMHGTSKKK